MKGAEETRTENAEATEHAVPRALEAAQTLRAFDPNLPALASQAAIEIDNILVHHAAPGGHGAIRKLAQALRTSTGTPNEAPQHIGLDPVTLNVLHGAVRGHTSYVPENLNALLEQSQELAGELENAASIPDLDGEILRRLRDFCVALSGHARAYAQAKHESSDRHPFRKCYL